MTTPPIAYFPNGPNANPYGHRSGTYGRDSLSRSPSYALALTAVAWLITEQAP